MSHGGSAPPRVLVIGATSAIGQAVARRYAAEGASFALVARDPEKLRAVADDLRARGAAEVDTAVADLRELDTHESLIEGCWREAGGPDVALIAHGTLSDQERCERDPAYLADEMNTNVVSVLSLATLLAARFESRGSGTLGVITSVAGVRGRRRNHAYGAAKAAVITFLEGMRARLRGSSVSVVDIRPGLIRSPMTAHLPQGPLFVDPERVAAPIHRALRSGRAVVYVPWFWRPVMWVVRRLPRGVLERLDL